MQTVVDPSLDPPPDDPTALLARIQYLENDLTRLEHRLQEAQIVNRVLVTAASQPFTHVVFDAICFELANAFGVPQAALALLNPEKTCLDVVAEFCTPGHPSGLGEKIAVAGNPLTEYVLVHRVPMVAVDAQHDPRLEACHDLMRRRGTVSLMVVPIFMGSEIIGTLGIDAVERREFTQDEIDLAQRVALAASQIVRTARLYTELQKEIEERKKAQTTLEELAAQDPLTGICNRRQFFALAAQQLAFARRYGTPMSLVMIDIDHYKRINDTFGHQAGDQALCAIAAIIAGITRQADILARYAGDEFVILLVNSDGYQAWQVAERLRSTFHTRHVLTEAGEVAVTLSLGIAELDQAVNTVDELISRADKALYDAKQAGRDCACLYRHRAAS